MRHLPLHLVLLLASISLSSSSVWPQQQKERPVARIVTVCFRWTTSKAGARCSSNWSARATWRASSPSVGTAAIHRSSGGMSCSPNATRPPARLRSGGTCVTEPPLRQPAWATKRVKHGMNKRRPKLPLTATWTCPHCGHVHTPATLRRLDSITLQCQACKRPFASAPNEE